MRLAAASVTILALPVPVLPVCVHTCCGRVRILEIDQLVDFYRLEDVLAFHEQVFGCVDACRFEG